MCWPEAGGSVSMPNEQEDVGNKYALKGPESKGELSMSDITEKRKAEIHITLNSITQLYGFLQ